MNTETLKNYVFPNGNWLHTLTGYQEVMDNWKFLEEGLEQMNNPKKANMCEPNDAFFKTAIAASSRWPRAFVGVLKSKNDKPLGYGIGFDTTSEFQTGKTLYIYATYSNRLYNDCVPDMLKWADKFARQFRFSEIVTATGRINGNAFYWHEKKLGFSRRCIVFRKEI